MQGSGVKATLLSYEGPFGAGYGVMKFENTDEEVDTYKELKEYEENAYKEKIKNSNPYVKLARENLEHYFKYKEPIKDLGNIPVDLKNQKHGAFVSLKKFKNLRGCIGTIQSTTNNVYEETIKISIEAALHDPRFPEVTEDELKDIDISVDALRRKVLCYWMLTSMYIIEMLLLFQYKYYIVISYGINDKVINIINYIF